VNKRSLLVLGSRGGREGKERERREERRMESKKL
jgi:hypothetical protein